MNENIAKEAARLLKKSRRRKIWRVVVMTLAVVVAFSTFHLLIIPAITMEKEPVCGIEEHTHGPECYREEKVLICTEEESPEHTHTDECYRTERVLICEKKEHVHTAECFEHADPKADTETRSDWEATVAEADLEGKWDKDLVSVAETQLGYEESKDNYVRDKNGDKLGYTRYGDWYGNTYAEWNNMFVSFCLNYANVPESAVPYMDDISEWKHNFIKNGLYKDISKEAPESGDILFLDKSGDGQADSVAVVDSVKSQAAGKGKVTVIEGDDKDKVEMNTYSLKDKEISGFGQLSVTHSAKTKAVTRRPQYGRYWKLIRNTGELRNGQTYIIMAADGTYAASLGDSCRQVNIEPVKGNPDYFIINNVSNTSMLRYEGGNVFRKDNNYIDPRNTGGCFSSNRNGLIIERSNTPGCFWISQNGNGGRFYLNMDGEQRRLKGFRNTKAIYQGNHYQFRPGMKGPAHKFNQTADMMILQMVNTTLQIPDDAPPLFPGNGQTATATKPKYNPYLAVSDKKTGTYDDSRGTFNYYSDPSTSQLESQFGDNPLQGRTDFNAQKVDDGKTLTDKSVIYRHDDYGAIDNYEDGTFGVTLSALGQTYARLPKETVPLDVIFILDLSASMIEKEPGQSKPRAQLLAESLNNSIRKLMAAHPENRFAAVGFNTWGHDFYPMGHHAPGAGNMYFQYSGQNMTALSPTSYRRSVQVGTSGTYTQIGLAQAYQMMQRVTDTTYTITVNGETVTKKRKPVIVLLSDGGPSHCTCFYTDVLHSPYYGDANGWDFNSKGVHGYYAILSANYYKRMIGIHYDCQPTMYTVAGAISEYSSQCTGLENLTFHYRATVLNPTNANIEYLRTMSSNAGKVAIVERMLYNLLKGTHNDPVDLGGFFDFNPSLGKPHRYVGIVKNNPYRPNYSYADKAYFNNRAANGIEIALDDIFNLNKVSFYTYETLANSTVNVSDPIGYDMEIKGDPVLRVNGKNFTHTEKIVVSDSVVQYKYEGIVPMGQHNTKNTIDLSTIVVTVETDAAGLQTVRMTIPPNNLPVYTPDDTLSFYYESLPIRLIYKVGLAQSAQDKINSLGNGRTITFYTNRYESGNHAEGTLQPSAQNPYYKTNRWKEHIDKTDNTTATDTYSRDIGGTAKDVLQSLGNNGKITYTKNGTIENEISILKKWHDYHGNPKTTYLPESITGTLYRTYLNEAGETVREDVIVDFTLTAETDWKIKFTADQLKEVAGRKYKYYVEETNSAAGDYEVEYSGDGIAGNTPDSPIIITNRYKYGDFELPNTGGPGTTGITVAGLFIVTACLIYGYASRRKKIGRRSG